MGGFGAEGIVFEAVKVGEVMRPLLFWLFPMLLFGVLFMLRFNGGGTGEWWDGVCWWMGCGGWSSNATERWTPSLRKCLIRGLIIVSPRWVFSFGMQCAGLAKRSRRRDTSVYSHVKMAFVNTQGKGGVGGTVLSDKWREQEGTNIPVLHGSKRERESFTRALLLHP